MYIDAFQDYKSDKIRVAERRNGQRHLVDYDIEHVFYYTHPSGQYRTMSGETCRRHVSKDSQKFKADIRRISTITTKSGKLQHKIFESDINPVFRALETHYKGADTPDPHVAFFDIETGFDEDRGFAPVDDPFNPITAITTWLSNGDMLITVALCPPTLTLDEAREMVKDFPNTFIFDDEIEMICTFCAIIDDTDILSGWNSTFFDIPYVVNRMRLLMGDDSTSRLCLWDQKPRPREIMKYGKEHPTYDLVGRVHLDYLELYQKHNTQQQHSYRLDFIGHVEVGENKVQYTGTLDDLYKRDFYKFIEYSRQDVELLVKIDRKKRFLDLANQIAHVNCVLFKTTMGSVALVEQAIILEIHQMGLIAPNRKIKEIIETTDDYDPFGDDDEEDDEKKPVVGAYVAKPKVGLHDHVAAIDINSLYPSTIRALNISPETIVGQLRQDETKSLVATRIAEGTPRAEAWDGIFASLEVTHMWNQDESKALVVDFDDGTTKTFNGATLYEYIFNPRNHLCISANGTIFKTDRDGIIPQLLAKWYAERQELQRTKGFYAKLSKGIGVDDELGDSIMAHLSALKSKTSED